MKPRVLVMAGDKFCRMSQYAAAPILLPILRSKLGPIFEKLAHTTTEVSPLRTLRVSLLFSTETFPAASNLLQTDF